MTTDTGDTPLRQQALHSMLGHKPDVEMLKPGEPLPDASDYPQKFISDYNAFQKEYKEKYDSNPGYYDYGAQHWGEVKRLMDEYRTDIRDVESQRAFDRLYKAKPNFEQPKPPQPVEKDFD